MEYTPEVTFSRLDIIKMAIKLTGWSIVQARVACDAFIRYLGLPAGSSVGSNSLPLFIKFMGFFTRGVLEVNDLGMGIVIIEFSNAPKVQDSDITRLMGE